MISQDALSPSLHVSALCLISDIDANWRVLQPPCNAADQLCSSGSEVVACGVIQESKKRSRDGDELGDTSVPSKRARLEATDASGPGTHVSTGNKEEEESRQSKQALITDRLFSFKVSACCSELGMLPNLRVPAVTIHCWSGCLNTTSRACKQSI